MPTKFALSIAISSLAALGAIATPVSAQADGTVTPSPASGGKCASGKCGTEKIYQQADAGKDPQDRLVRARDGKCGLTAHGHAVVATPAGKLAEGVCGQ
jgi:uncharacterized low-complexity protein